MIVAEDVPPDSSLAEVNAHHRTNLLTSQASPQNHQLQQQQQYQQQNPYQHHHTQIQHQLQHQPYPQHHQGNQPTNIRQPDFKTATNTTSMPRTSEPVMNSSHNARQTTSSAMVYSSQPTAMGKPCFYVNVSRVLDCLVAFGLSIKPAKYLTSAI